MNLSKTLRQAWQTLWHYRALWLFGAVLALVGGTLISPGPWLNRDQEDDHWTEIKLSDKASLWLPGPDLVVDLTAPEGARITLPEGASWAEFHQEMAMLERKELIYPRTILVWFGVVLAGAVLLGTVLSYVTETALIRMVDEAEATGQRLGVRAGLRRGWSARAWRLFALDVVIGLLGGVVFLVGLGLAVAPLLLAIGQGEAILVTAGVGSLGLLVLGGYLWLLANSLLALVLQPVRRACLLEEGRFLPAVRQGISLVKAHLKQVSLVWLVWMAIRLIWLPLGAVIFFLLVPTMIVTSLLGLAVGSLPAAVVGMVAMLFTSTPTAWIMAALAGLPVFIPVLFAPMFFISGLVEVYLSTIWTLTYRQLRASERPVEEAAPLPRMAPGANATSAERPGAQNPAAAD